MLHPFFSTIVKRPDLVIEHLSGYAALLHQEAASAGAELLTRVVAWVVAVLLGVVFLALAGTALMLGFLQNQFHWVLIAVPGVTLLFTVMAVVRAMKPFQSERFPELKAQIDSDTRALRSVA
jgi:type IV secretory pathway VirB2 component (pilin)